MIDPRPNVATRRARRQLLLLAAIFSLPVLIAYALYFSGWRPEASGNYGELVQPPRPLPGLTLQTLDGKTLRLSELQGKWTLLMFGNAECPAPCAATLDKIHRIILAQGNKAERVRAVFVVTDPRARDWLQYAIKDYPGTLALLGSTDTIRILMSYFVLSKATPANDPNRIYVVDPLGNFMMSYPAEADASRVRKDLARLLRVSQVG